MHELKHGEIKEEIRPKVKKRMEGGRPASNVGCPANTHGHPALPPRPPGLFTRPGWLRLSPRPPGLTNMAARPCQVPPLQHACKETQM